jgi:hypothetical protein
MCFQFPFTIKNTYIKFKCPKNIQYKFIIISIIIWGRNKNTRFCLNLGYSKFYWRTMTIHLVEIQKKNCGRISVQKWCLQMIFHYSDVCLKTHIWSQLVLLLYWWHMAGHFLTQCNRWALRGGAILQSYKWYLQILLLSIFSWWNVWGQFLLISEFLGSTGPRKLRLSMCI